MWRILTSLGYLVALIGTVLLAVTIISTLILALATALTYVFSVSVWEAAVVVTAASAGVYRPHVTAQFPMIRSTISQSHRTTRTRSRAS